MDRKKIVKIMGAAGNALLNLQYPRVCPVCGEILTRFNRATENAGTERSRQEMGGCSPNVGLGGYGPGAGGGNPYICGNCLPLLKIPDGARCLKCSAPLKDDGEEYCETCAERTRHFDKGIALYRHNDEARNIIYGMKFFNLKDNADFAALAMAENLGREIIAWDCEAMIPVPLHPSRLRERGYNQAELLARKFSEDMKEMYGAEIPVVRDLLLRTKKTKPQKELDGFERVSNMHKAFSVNGKYAVTEGGTEGDDPAGRPGFGCTKAGEDSCFGGMQTREHPPRIPYRRLLLVDDIFTTGTTLSECAGTLKAAGAEKVFFVTVSIVC